VDGAHAENASFMTCFPGHSGKFGINEYGEHCDALRLIGAPAAIQSLITDPSRAGSRSAAFPGAREKGAVVRAVGVEPT